MKKFLVSVVVLLGALAVVTGCDDASGSGGGGQPNACGGRGTLDATPGESCGECGVWTCDGTEALRCEDPGKNACGGCAQLEHQPGESCGECGVWTCDGSDALRCDDPGKNACGGCAQLDHEPGTSCFGEVDGVTACAKWECDGTEDTTCIDPGLNPCGGCSELEHQPGESCGECGNTAIYVCSEDGESVICKNVASSPENADYLGTWSDRDTDYGWVTVEGTLDSANQEDWYKARMYDSMWGIVDPVFKLTNPAGARYRLCVYFAREYPDTEVSCSTGNASTYTFGNEEWPGCCTGPDGGTIELDMGQGGDDDNGFFYMQVKYVEGAPNQECDPYQLKFHF